jgi:FkbM family methyltransferase
MRIKNKIFTKRFKCGSKMFEIMLRPDADESVVAEIFDWREYRAAEEIIAGCQAPILDVGAHIGIFALYVRTLNPLVLILALEPEADNFALLKNNLEANDIKNIRLFKAALSGKTGPRPLLLEADSINHHLEEEISSGAGHRKSEQVKTFSLPDFLTESGIEKVGLVKLDIEGGEYEVFAAMAAEDFARVENVILEYHDGSAGHHKELESLLRRNGFGVQIFPSGFEKDMGFLLARNKRKG